MSQVPHTTAVIVTYNSVTTIGQALDAARLSVEARELDVVLVDNASQDGTVDYVRSRYPWVEVIEHGANHGFARGCNRGFERVSTPYTLFLNPDAELGQDAFRTLYEFMESRPDCGVCAPALVYPRGVLQLAGMMATPWALIRQGLWGGSPSEKRSIEPGCEAFETNWLCGAVFLIRSDVFRAVGMMDPRYFLYFEETDIWRAVMRHNFSLWAVGKSVAKHEGGSSAKGSGRILANGCIAEFYYPSRFYYLRKNFGLVASIGAETITFGTFLIRSLLKRALGKPTLPIRDRLAGGLCRAPKPVPNAAPPESN